MTKLAIPEVVFSVNPINSKIRSATVYCFNYFIPTKALWISIVLSILQKQTDSEMLMNVPEVIQLASLAISKAYRAKAIYS